MPEQREHSAYCSANDPETQCLCDADVPSRLHPIGPPPRNPHRNSTRTPAADVGADDDAEEQT